MSCFNSFLNYNKDVKTKKGEKEKLRRVILEKAISFFKRNGRSGSASEDLMKNMGLTRGALYSHFKSKDDLFAHAVSHDLDRLEEITAFIIKRDGPLALRTMIETHLSENSLTDIESRAIDVVPEYSEKPDYSEFIERLEKIK